MRIKPFFVRASRFGRSDLAKRIPELSSLQDCTVALFGVGCVGAPLALELARAGLRELRIVDGDVVDPSASVRWPLGLQASGVLKAVALRDFIQANYPFTVVKPYPFRVGAARFSGDEGGPGESEIICEVIKGASVIVDATAEFYVQYYLSDLSREAGLPYVCVWGTHGGWGGLTLRIVPEATEGCWLCYQHSLQDQSIQEPPSHPQGEIQPAGCGDPTFTGAGFDMAQVGLFGAREVASLLCRDTDGAYPAGGWDLLTMAFRDEAGRLIVPKFDGHVLKRHPSCERCSGPS